MRWESEGARVTIMPPILFIITSPSGEVIYHCHDLLELFRLRGVYNPSHDAEVYRYVDTKVSVQTDKYFQWDRAKRIWLVSDASIGTGIGTGFQRITYASLEPIYNIMKGMK
jgi:hypothetical protein